MYKASASASFMSIITAVFLLISAQLAMALAQQRVSAMSERAGGLYDIGVSAAEAKERDMNARLLNAEMDIVREYMNTNSWADGLTTGAALELDGAAFWQAYKAIALKYVNPTENISARIKHTSGLDIDIQSKFYAFGTNFTITVTNSGARPEVKNMLSNKAQIQGVFAWSETLPAYTLTPRFDYEDEGFDGKTADDFIITRKAQTFKPVILSAVCRT